MTTMMKTTMPTALAAMTLCAALSACAGFGKPPVTAGEPEQEVVARLGRPTHVYRSGNERLLEYMGGPMGQTTYMARIGPDGRLVSYEQVLTLQKFGTIKPGQAHKDDVLRIIGAPSDVYRYARLHEEGWAYPYRENNAWDSEMTVFFDSSGTVTRLQNGPDPRRMPNDRMLGNR